MLLFLGYVNKLSFVIVHMSQDDFNHAILSWCPTVTCQVHITKMIVNFLFCYSYIYCLMQSGNGTSIQLRNEGVASFPGLLSPNAVTRWVIEGLGTRLMRKLINIKIWGKPIGKSVDNEIPHPLRVYAERVR